MYWKQPRGELSFHEVRVLMMAQEPTPAGLETESILEKRLVNGMVISRNMHGFVKMIAPMILIGVKKMMTVTGMITVRPAAGILLTTLTMSTTTQNKFIYFTPPIIPLRCPVGR